MIERRFLIGMLVATSCAVGCGGRTPQPDVADPEATATTIEVEPDTYEFTREGTFPEVSAATPQAPTQTTSETVTTESFAPAPSERRTAPVLRLDGYRVQVFAGHSWETAEQIRAQLEKDALRGVYVEYIEPYYKVRVGDCTTRTVCEELRNELQKTGYPSAWIVRTIINP